MSAIPLDIAKRRLRTIGTHADADLQQALDGAEQEACRYLNRTQLPTLPQDWPCSSEEVPSSDDPVAPDVVEGVLGTHVAHRPRDHDSQLSLVLQVLRPRGVRDVVARPADDGVVARATLDPVVAAVAPEGVVTLAGHRPGPCCPVRECGRRNCVPHIR